MNNIWILAQADTNTKSEPTTITAEPVNKQTEPVTVVPGSQPPPAPAPPKKGFEYGNLIFLALMFVVMYLLLFRGPRKKQQEHLRMVKSLQKNDKVQTIGGVIGIVVDVRDDEITLKVDENNNTKIKVIPSAIGRNISKETT
jgi:preprotein translocase subunit YajC